MTERKTTRRTPVQPLTKKLPQLLEKALARHHDFIVTFETDPDTRKITIHAITGKCVTPCMRQKLLGEAEAQRDEGASIVSGPWA